MATVSSRNTAVSLASFPAPPVFVQSQPDVSSSQSISPPVSSSPAKDISVSISPEARDASSKVRIAGETTDNGTRTVTGQNISSSADLNKDKKIKTALPADKSNVRMADEKSRAEEESRKNIERLKDERRNEEDLRLEKESANAAEDKKKEQKKAEKAENEKQSEKRNILDALIETNRSSYANRRLIDAAINGYQMKQSGKAVNVIGGTSEDSTKLFIDRSTNQSLSSINLLV